jgi:hypothetical protein
MPESSFDLLLQKLQQTLLCVGTSSESDERRLLLRDLEILIEKADQNSDKVQV